MFQNCFRISKLQESFTTYKWVNNVHDVWRISYSLEYNKTKECEILIFGDDLKFWSFFKMKHWICLNDLHTFKNSYLFNNDWPKKCDPSGNI
jgi:hypothetical protein